MKKNLLTFLAIFIAVFTFNRAYATDYTVEPNPAIKSNTIPIFRSSASMRGSITQQIYLPSEFSPSGASAGNITAVSFYYAAKDANTVNEFSRSVEIWLSETAVESYSLDKVGTTYNSKFLPKGTKVYEGNLVTKDDITSSNGDQTLTLTFNVTQFPWDGSSNIVLTLYDKSTTDVGSNANNYLKFYITATDHARFVHQQWIYSAYSFTDDRDAWMANLHERYGFAYGSGVNDSTGYANKRNYVPKTTFTIVPSISAPANLSVSSISTSSAHLSWDAVDDATAYNVRWGTTSGSLSESEEGVTNTYLDIDELEDGTTYYFDVQAVTADGTSAFASEVIFETLGITHEHNGISFSKWKSTTSMPTSGNYYLANDVELTTHTSLTGNLNLCLNGHTVLTSSNCIIVPDGVTFAIFDNEGSGVIRGAYPGGYSESGLISVKNGGTLKIGEGGIVNLADDANDYNLAIDNKGTLLLSGAPTISGVKADIYLGTSKVITIESGKPLTNSTPYTVDAVGQVITSGWANMGGANPANFFASAKSGYPAVVLDGGEAKLVAAISLSQNDSEETFNSKISGKVNTVINVSLDRSFTSASYNTVCLPFDLTDAQLQAVFGSGYDLLSFQDADLDGETLQLNFSKVTTLSAGVPYLIQPSIDVVNPTFNGVTIPDEHTATPTAQSSTYIDFQGVYSPTNVGSGKNILFVGANNELFWNNNASGELKGFRAFFTAKGSAAKAVKAHIVKKDNTATAIDHVQGDDAPCRKVLHNGQLFILHKGTKYNVQGQMVK